MENKRYKLSKRKNIFPIVHIDLAAAAAAADAAASAAAAAASAAKSLQSCSNLCDPIDGSPPGPTIPGIL